MTTANRSVRVEAPADQVRDYLSTPNNIVEWWPDCVEIHDLIREPGGYAFGWTDSPAGVPCHGEMRETVEGAGETIALRLTGDLHGLMTWRAEPEGGGTRVTFQSDYDLPVRALIPYLTPARLLRFQQDEADAVTAKVREKFGGL